MSDQIANDLIRYAELVEDCALISPEEMNCASLMRLAAEALAQPAVTEQHKQEPVAWRFYDGKMWCYVNHLTDLPQSKFEPLYTTAPQHKPLTDEQLEQIHQQYGGNIKKIMRAVEAKLKEKNT